jgi:hypothetical protein
VPQPIIGQDALSMAVMSIAALIGFALLLGVFGVLALVSAGCVKWRARQRARSETPATPPIR